MAKITYADKVALNENPNVNAINKVRDVDMNEIKEVINDNETKVLLAVSSSAPATCDTGDIYFNTTDNLIYTATATNTWSSTGVAPTENTIYIEFTSQTAYAYDGTTLVSVGGGAGGGGETLPIGSEIDFDGSVSDIPDGWEEVSGKSLVAYDLYSNASGSNANITLSDSAANYNYIEIFFKSNDNVYSSVKGINGTTIMCHIVSTITSTAYWYNPVLTTYSINGTSLSISNKVSYNITNNWAKTDSGNNLNNIYITKVIGYKEV